MAVSKRVRYEVLKRDNHTCRYCGASAPDVTLHVDHVIPLALGGSDKPDNLVTACKDCNLGKTSTSATDSIVAEVDEKALAWTVALRKAMDDIAIESKERRKVTKWFVTEWHHRYGESMGELPADWRTTVAEFVKMGVPIDLIDEAIDITCDKGLSDHKNFRYFAGICWNHVRAIQERAQASLQRLEPKPCGHCYVCRHPEYFGPESSEPSACYLLRDPATAPTQECPVCGSRLCTYSIAYEDGYDAGGQDEWNRHHVAVEHYKTCPEVNRG